MQPRLDEIQSQLLRGESVDWPLEASLQALEAVRLGESFKDEILKQMDQGSKRYANVKSIEFLPDGGIARVEFHEPPQQKGGDP